MYSRLISGKLSCVKSLLNKKVKSALPGLRRNQSSFQLKINSAFNLKQGEGEVKTHKIQGT